MKHIARKRFGQHFLTDSAIIHRIVGVIDPRPGDALVEIGPGLGAMTDPLVASTGRLTVIELDRDLAARLRRRPELEVVEADVLTVDFAALAQQAGRPLRVVGNLPYNISTPILFHLLGAVDHVADQHFMLQKEVVQRMAAGPGGKDYGRLSVMLQWRYDIESVLDVPPDAFEPPPRVDSAVARARAGRPPGVDRGRPGLPAGTARLWRPERAGQGGPYARPVPAGRGDAPSRSTGTAGGTCSGTARSRRRAPPSS